MPLMKCMVCVLFALFLAVAAAQNIPGVGDISKAATGKGGLLDLNSATSKQLQGLPGIGSALASQIIKGRPYKATNELVSKNILSQEVFDKIKNLIFVKPK